MIIAEGFLEAARYQRLERILGYEFSKDCKSFKALQNIEAYLIAKSSIYWCVLEFRKTHIQNIAT